jgi:hypothetical protein
MIERRTNEQVPTRKENSSGLCGNAGDTKGRKLEETGDHKHATKVQLKGDFAKDT